MKTKTKSGVVSDPKPVDVAQLRAKSAIGKGRLLNEHVQACISQMNTRATLGFYSCHHVVDDVRLADAIVNELKTIKELYVETSHQEQKTTITMRW